MTHEHNPTSLVQIAGFSARLTLPLAAESTVLPLSAEAVRRLAQALGVHNHVWLTLDDLAGGTETVKARAWNGQILLARAAEGCAARHFAPGTRVDTRVTLAAVAELIEQARVTDAHIHALINSHACELDVHGGCGHVHPQRDGDCFDR